MHSGIKKAAIICSLLATAFSPIERPAEPVNYYVLRDLAGAETPKRMRVLKLANGSFQKSVIEEGVLVTFKSREAGRVDVAGNFSSWRPLRMERGNRGVWYYLITNPVKKKEIQYKFVVDGIWTSDPKNPLRAYDGNGSYLSVIESFTVPEGRHVSYRLIDGSTVEFRTWNPTARMISLVGDFNHWNPEDDLLAKGRDGIWRVRKKLFPGVYRYKFIIDGEWLPDVYNSESASDDTGEVCSILEIKK